MPETNEGSPTINVGRDFKMGNVSGQVATGSGINQYKDCTFILPDGSAIQGKLWFYTQGIRPTTDPEIIFGRQQELEKIDEYFKDNHSLAITGLEGIGKSTVASKYVDRLEKKAEYAGIYWRKIDENIDISDVVGSFFTVIGKPITNIGAYKLEDQLSLLFKELDTAPYFLVFDNFQTVIDPKTNEPLRPGFSDLIEKASETIGQSRFLFTCWECPANVRGIRPAFYKIGGLDSQAAVKLLRKRGLKTEPENELTQAVELSGGHPLALILLVQLVKKEEAETLSQALADDSLWEGEVAQNVLDKVYKTLSEDEQKFLQYLSLYREPVPARAIVVVANDPNWTENEAKKRAWNLNKKSLLNKAGENYWIESLTRKYVYDKVEDKINRHKLACEYYLSLPVPAKPTKRIDIQPLMEAYYHAYLAKEYDKAAEILLHKTLCYYLDMWGNYRTITELCTALLPENPLKDKPLLSKESDHVETLGSLGHAYNDLDEYRKAIECYEEALGIAKQIPDKENQSKLLGGLGEAYLDLDEYRKAIECYEEALGIAKQIEDKRTRLQFEGKWLGGLGNTYRNLDEYRKAIEHYRQALKIAKQIKDKKSMGEWLGGHGLAHLNLGEYRDAIEDFGNALEIAKQVKDKQFEGKWLGCLGSAHRGLEEHKEAFEYYEKAIEIADQIEDKQNKGNWLVGYGNVFADLRDYDKAIDHYQKALKIAQQIADRRNESTCLGNLGKTYISLRENEKAIEFLEKALKIAAQIGDRRNEGAWLNHLGRAFTVEKKNAETLACYLRAKQLRAELGNAQELAETETNIKDLREKLGQEEFTRLQAEVTPRANEIVQKTLQENQNK